MWTKQSSSLKSSNLQFELSKNKHFKARCKHSLQAHGAGLQAQGGSCAALIHGAHSHPHWLKKKHLQGYKKMPTISTSIPDAFCSFFLLFFPARRGGTLTPRGSEGQCLFGRLLIRGSLACHVLPGRWWDEGPAFGLPAAQTASAELGCGTEACLSVSCSQNPASQLCSWPRWGRGGNEAGCRDLWEPEPKMMESHLCPMGP